MYQLIEAGEKTYYITAPVTVGIYQLNETEVCLIDSGNNRKVAEDVLAIVESRGWKVNCIINTHSHADHVGGNELIQQKTGCAVYACAPDIMFVEYPVLERPFLSGGYPIKEIDTDFFLARPSKAAPLTAKTLPKGLETVRLDGHAVAMVGIRTDDDIWFIGDILSSKETFKKQPVPYVFQVEEHLKSLERVKTLSGKLFIPSHEPVMTDVKELADFNLEKIHEMIGLIKELTREPISFEEILKKVLDHYGSKMTHSRYVLTGGTIRSYLAYLHNRGETDIVFQDNRMLWHTK